MKYLKPFTKIAEARELDPAVDAEITQMGTSLKNLRQLMHLGIIQDRDAYKSMVVKITRAFNKIIKDLKLDLTDQADIELLKSLGEKAGRTSFLGLDSEGAKSLLAKGLHLVSSPTQIARGTLIFSLDSEYRRKDGWAIGFFPESKVVRRMTPKGLKIGVWGRYEGSMDINIKYFRDTINDLDFYNTAMLWAAENIDFKGAKENPEPTVWKYYVNRPNLKYPDQDEKEILDAKSKLGPSNDLNSLEASLNYFQLRLNYLNKHGKDIYNWPKEDILRRIDSIVTDIKKIKN